MDYENIKAMIKARMKIFQDKGNVEAVKACETILQDLEIGWSIYQHQLQEKARYV
jgi:hypothetical protein